MIKCSECGASQPEGTLFCSECGSFLAETTPKMTVQLPFTQFGRLPTPPPVVHENLELIAGTKSITMFVPSSRKRIQFELQNEFRVGRADSDTGLFPELDLSEFDAAVHGVSRLHAIMQLTNAGVALIDLESTNGTYLNNYRLNGNQPYLLSNGDEVLFGDLLVHFFFEA